MQSPKNTPPIDAYQTNLNNNGNDYEIKIYENGNNRVLQASNDNGYDILNGKEEKLENEEEDIEKIPQKKKKKINNGNESQNSYDTLNQENINEGYYYSRKRDDFNPNYYSYQEGNNNDYFDNNITHLLEQLESIRSNLQTADENVQNLIKTSLTYSKEEKDLPQLKVTSILISESVNKLNDLIEKQSQLQRKGTGAPFNWNQKFQEILEFPQINEESKLQKYSKLMELANDFVHFSKIYGKIIIFEAFFKPNEKTIKPVNIGGHAGGPKYIHHGIYFKFATDWESIYGSDENAARAAGHELKALMRFCDCEGLSVPLMTLVDYRGFRLVCMSILPIKGSNSLIYGSNDSGHHVFSLNEKVNQLIKLAAKKLNLKGHIGGFTESTAFIYTPTDIEVHQGHDNRFYLIDFARVFPPQTPDKTFGCVWYKLLRPEFVGKYKLPLSSDAFTKFGTEGREIHDNEVRDATKNLLEEVIPKFALWLQANYENINNIEMQITQVIHRDGINCRFLGLIRSHISDITLRRILLIEMISRAIKVEVRKRNREQMRELGSTLSEGTFRSLVINFFNLILGVKPESQLFWKSEIKAWLQTKFLKSLDESELNPSFDLREVVPMADLFRILQHKTGVYLSETAQAEIAQVKFPKTKFFALVEPDIQKVATKVKKMNLISQAEGNVFAIASLLHKGESNDENTSEKLFKLAMKNFQSAIDATPDNVAILIDYANYLYKYATQLPFSKCAHYFKLALDTYQLAGASQYISTVMNRIETILKEENFGNWKFLTELETLLIKCYIEGPTAGSTSTLFKLGSILLTKSKRFRDPSTGLQFYNQAVESFSSLIKSWEKFQLKEDKINSAILLGLPPWSVELSGPSFTVLVDILQNSNDLTKIDLSDCFKMSDASFIGIFAHWRQLQTLSLKKFKGTEASLVSLASKYSESLISLESISFPNFSSPVISLIMQYTSKLHTCSLSDCYQLNDESIKELLPCLLRIQNLNLSGCRNITDNGWLMIAKTCTNVVNLNVNYCGKISSQTFSELTKLWVKLEVLSASWCHQFSVANLKTLSTFAPNIHTLYFALCSVDDSWIKIFSKFTKLSYLDLSGNENLICIKHLHDCKELTFLDVSSCPKLSSSKYLDSDIQFIFNSHPCPHIKHLRLENLNLRDSNTLKYISMKCPEIENINIRYSTKIPDIGIRYLFSCTRLTSLNLFGCQTVLSSTIEKLVSLCPHLREVDLSHCAQIENMAVKTLALNCKNISDLALSSCVQLTDLSFELDAPQFYFIKSLRLRGCVKITDKSLESISRNCRFLKHIDLTLCYKVTQKGILNLKNAYEEILIDLAS